MSLARKIAALERLAASTTFAGERESALAQAAKLRAKLGPASRSAPDGAWAERLRVAERIARREREMKEEWAACEQRRRARIDAERARAVCDLKAVRVAKDDPVRGPLWEVEGEGTLDENQLQAVWCERLAAAKSER